MAIKNARAALTTTTASVYTAPATGAKVTMIQVANVDGANAVDVTVQWTDASASHAVTRLCFNSTVAAKDALSVPAGGLLLESGDRIQALASAASDAEITICVLEG
ncbi:hypothetical protein [Devosia sp. 919]|uniref:hypothetical protein n=1 Tax=Devosia sp. 919 TaxID=2726065 RepID=UPI0015532AD3|nr:hypothetical protein [Devosia sp. 919]